MEKKFLIWIASVNLFVLLIVKRFILNIILIILANILLFIISNNNYKTIIELFCVLSIFLFYFVETREDKASFFLCGLKKITRISSRLFIILILLFAEMVIIKQVH